MPAATNDSEQTGVMPALQLDGDAKYPSAVGVGGNAAPCCSGPSSRSGLGHQAPGFPDLDTRSRPIRKQGQGGMGAVCLREDDQSHSTVAVKVMPPLCISSEQCTDEDGISPTADVDVLGQSVQACAIESRYSLPTSDHDTTGLLSRDCVAPIEGEET